MFERESPERAGSAPAGRFAAGPQTAAAAPEAAAGGLAREADAPSTGASANQGAGKLMSHWGDASKAAGAPPAASAGGTRDKDDAAPHASRHDTAAATETRSPAFVQRLASPGFERSWGAMEQAAQAVQRKADPKGAVPDGEKTQQTAAEGLQGGGQPLPHLEAIQQSFGRHDVQGVKALIGGPAAQAAKKIGAQAYASGEKIAFQSEPDLHTAAHEAAHVVQQRGGVSLPGGVGQQGDAYETHANAVADLVVRGESAERLLDEYSPARGTGARGGGAVQRDGGGNTNAPADISKQCRLVARVPAGVLLGAGLQDPLTDALAREIWCHSANADGQTYYLNCPADGHIHFLDDKGVPLPTAKSFFQTQYDQILQIPRVQPVAGDAVTDRSRKCATAVRSAFDSDDGQEILRQLNLGAEIVRGAVKIYDSELNTLGGKGLTGDIKDRFPGLYPEAVIELKNAGVVVADDIGVDRTNDKQANTILRDTRIVSIPASPLVTPGASITYSLQTPTIWASQDYQLHAGWSRLLDPFTTPKGQNSFDYLSGPQDQLSWKTQWDAEGSYKIQCVIFGTWSTDPWDISWFRNWQRDPRAVMIEYEQVVLPKQVATDYAFAASSAVDPRDQVAQLQKMLEALRAAAKQSGQTLDPAIEQGLQKQIDQINGVLASTAQQQRTPIHAVHVSTENGQVTQLQVLVATPITTTIATPAPGGGTPAPAAASSGQQTWQIVDATNAGDERLHGTYTGTGATAAEAIRAAIADWKTHCQYPPGTIKLEVPKEVAKEAISDQFETNGNSWADLAQFLQAVGGAMGIVGTIGAFICPAFGVVALIGGVVSAAGAAVDMAQRHYYRTATLGSDGMDLLTIATAFFSAGRTLGKGAKILSQGVERGLIVGEFVANGTQFVVMNAQFIDRAARAMALPDPQQRLEALLDVLKDAVINDGMTLLSLKGLAKEYKQVGHEAAPADITTDLSDGSKTVKIDDLPPPKAVDETTPAADPAAGSDTAVSPDQAAGMVDANGIPTAKALADPMNHPEWPKFEQAMVKFGVDPAKAEELWKSVLSGLSHGEKDFTEVTEYLKQTSGITNFKKPSLWSGNLMGALAQHLGFDTMSETALGGSMAQLSLGDWGVTRPFWVAMSRAYASELRGIVDVFMSQYNPGSIVITDELKVVAELQASGLVSEVRYHAVDPSSVSGGVQNSIFLDAQGNPQPSIVNLTSLEQVKAALLARQNALAAANGGGT